MSLKKIVVPALHAFSAWSGVSLRKAKALRVGRIIMFHGVGDDAYSETEFESHLQFLARNFSVVSLETITSRLESGRPLTDEIALTFDDGLRNNFTSAYPILKRLGLPATFFLCPALIENKRWLWNHEARARLNHMSSEQRRKLLAQFNVDFSLDVEQIVNWMKTLPLKKREETEQLIRNADKSFTPSTAQRQKYDMMSWEEARSLDPNVITIGSHTVNHPILSTLQPDELRFEIAESRRLLEQKLGRTVDQFCYPNGSHNPSVVEEVRKHYRMAVTTEPGFVQDKCDRLKLPRIGIISQPLLSWRMHRPTA